MTNTGQVVNIPPKTVTETYSKQPITITFIPSTRLWQWQVEYVRVSTMAMPFEGSEVSLEAARKAAHAVIDRLENNE